ncbi:MAG: hypothetical protein ACFFCP_06060 [Promethearchaeota archaeon]
MSSGTQYPKKGEYGPTIGRCKWCGKEDTHFWGVYCSRKCAAAGSFYSFAFATIISIGLTLWALISLYFVGIVVFGVFSAVFLYFTYAGARMRKN